MSRKPDAWLVDFDVNAITREAAGFIDGELESIANRIADEARGEEFPTSKTGKLDGTQPKITKHVPAHPFLRKAKNKVLMEVVAEFRSKYGKGA